MAEAARMGLKVARPHGDSARFDVIVEGGGKLSRVQVKSTLYRQKRAYVCLCFWSKAAGRRTYRSEEVDVIAAYVVPEDAWFIISVKELETKRLYLPTRESARRSKYGKYLDAWEQLGVDPKRLTIFASEDKWGMVVEWIKKKLRQ